jgi:hypothetical protein
MFLAFPYIQEKIICLMDQEYHTGKNYIFKEVLTSLFDSTAFELVKI